MRIKILHILHSLQVGGLENGVVNLINRLDPERFEHAICCIASSGPMAERIERQVPIHVIGKGAERDSLLPFKIAGVVRKVRPHVVHTRNWGTIDGIPGALLGGVRHIVHGEHGREAADPTGANRRRQQARRLLSPFVSRFITVSDDLRRWLVEDVRVSAAKVVQIINGVDTERFFPPDDHAAAKIRVGLDPSSFVVGTVGRLDPVKDQQLLLRAFGGFARGNSGGVLTPTLLLVGGGPEEERLRSLAADLGIADSVRFAGERRDTPELLRAMDLFVLPSIAEGISNTILEAMASGLPVLATDVGGNGELVIEGGNGFLFPSGNAHGLEELLLRCAADAPLRESLGTAARGRCLEHFSLKAMAEAYGRVYLEAGGMA